MTRQEFIDDILDMSDLYNFCANNRGYDHVIEDIYAEDALDDFVNNEVINYTDWRDLYNFLDDIPTGYDWYRIDCYGDITGIDDSEFEDIKSDAGLRQRAPGRTCPPASVGSSINRRPHGWRVSILCFPAMLMSAP